jgi:flagellar M-ring protein FliF
VPDKLSSSERTQIAVQMAEQQTLIETAKKDPYQVAQILQNWLGEENN